MFSAGGAGSNPSQPHHPRLLSSPDKETTDPRKANTPETERKPTQIGGTEGNGDFDGQPTVAGQSETDGPFSEPKEYTAAADRQTGRHRRTGRRRGGESNEDLPGWMEAGRPIRCDRRCGWLAAHRTAGRRSNLSEAPRRKRLTGRPGRRIWLLSLGEDSERTGGKVCSGGFSSSRAPSTTTDRPGQGPLASDRSVFTESSRVSSLKCRASTPICEAQTHTHTHTGLGA